MAIKTAVIYGSTRSERQGIKAARFLQRQLEARGHEVALIDPLVFPLPLLDKPYKSYAPGEAPEMMRRISELLAAADAFMIISGEYNHSIPPALKNLLDHFQSEYLYKPSGIVTYSAGPFGGVRGLANLRGIMAELGSPTIPSSFPISRVQAAFDEAGNALEASYESRASKFLDEFEWYANALRRARQSEACSQDSPTQQKMCREPG